MPHAARLAGVHLALVAILLRALLPAGWMPNPSGAAGTPLVVCTMDGPGHMMAEDKPAKPQHDRNGDHDHQVCPFAAAPHLVTPAIASALPLPSMVASTVLQFATFNAAERALRHTPQSPRAPPLPA